MVSPTHISFLVKGRADVPDSPTAKYFMLKFVHRNAPFHLGLRSVSLALAVGNTAVLKGSELSPRCYWVIADVMREAGLPDGCLNLIFHKPEDASLITNTLIAHPAIKHVNFTGSTRVGSLIAMEAAKHLKPVLMELGGKGNAIVLKDANMEVAATQCAMGAFLNVSIMLIYLNSVIPTPTDLT